MIEDMLNVKLNPREVFNFQNVTDEQLVENAGELGWGQASPKHLEESQGEYGFRSDLYIYYGLYKGKQAGLKDIDLYSYAGLIAGIISGLHGGFGTDTYKKEEIIEYKALDEYNMLTRAGLNPLSIARVLVEFVLEQYKTIVAARENLIPRNYTLREDQITLIREYASDNGKKNDSEALREIVDAGLQKLIIE